MLPATVLWPVDEVNEMVISSGLVTMGFALPAAIAAGYARPGTRVVCFTGDGGLGMCLGEMETLRRSGLPVTVVVQPEGPALDGATLTAEGVRVTAPVIETPGMVDGVVWAPSHSTDSRITVPSGTVGLKASRKP